MKNFFLISVLASLLLLAFVFFSCDNDDNFYLKVDKTEIILSSTNKQETFTVTSNGEWKLESPSLEYGIGIPTSFAEFYTLNQGMGEGSTTITVKLNEEINNDITNEILTIKGKNKSTTILVKKEK